MRFIVSLVAIQAIAGCGSSPARREAAGETQLTIRVTNADEHLGHSTAAEGASVHPVWIDGCRGRIVGTDEEFMLWWNGGEIRDYPFQFEAGKTYKLSIKGELGDGVMGYQGKCAHISQVLKVDR